MADEEKKPVAKSKNSTGRLFWQSFIVEDFSIVKDYLIFEVLVPTIKDTIVEASCSAINLIFTGDTGRRGRSGYSRSSYERDFNYNPYNNIYKTTQTGKFSKYEKERRSYEDTSYLRHSRTAYMDLIFPEKGQAIDALNELKDMLESQDGVVTVGDYYSIFEEITNETLPPSVVGNWALKEKYGWDDLSQVVVSGRRGEYYLTLPKAEPI